MTRYAVTVMIGIMIMISSLFVFTGCPASRADANDRPLAVAFVLGAHANSKGLNLNSDIVKETLEEAATSFGMVSVISNDGKPEMVYSRKYEVEDRYKGNRELLEKLGKEAAIKDLQQMQFVYANDSEVDTLEALRLATRTLESAPEGSQKVIVVLDTGLSTTGLLDFQNNLLNAEGQVIAQQLTEKKATPDLDGVTVYWQGLGDVEKPQPDLSPAQKESLKDIWKAIVEESGGVFDFKEYVPNPSDDDGKLPEVAVVNLPKETALMFDPEDVDFNEPRFLSEEQVQFIGDSDQYVDPKKAEAVIRPVASYMKKNRGFQMLLIGTTAGDGVSSYTMDLSGKRAERVKETLISLGIEGKRIRTIGMGSTDPWHIPNAGTGTDRMASQNRKVVLLDMDSEMARRLM